MREKYLWVGIVVLAALTLGQACYIYEQCVMAGESSGPPPVVTRAEMGEHSRKAYGSQWEEFEKWREKVRGQVGRGAPLLDPDFDGFFDDAYFSRGFDPFAEMERIHRRMSEEFIESERAMFDDAWWRWYGRRMKLGRFKMRTERTDSTVTIVLEVPGLASKTADISVTRDRIRLSFTARTRSVGGRGGTTDVSESEEIYVKIMPLPSEAEPGSEKVEIKGETVRIRFDLRKERK